MIKLPKLSSTCNVVTETAYELLSSEISNIITTVGNITDYVSAAEQQGEIAAISAANVAVSSMGVVGSHLDTILSTENNIKEISSDLVNNLSIVSEADNRFTILETVYKPLGINCIRGFENLTFDKVIHYPETLLNPPPVSAVEDGTYYNEGCFRCYNGSNTVISALSINKFNTTDDIAPVDLASTYITIANNTNVTIWFGQTGCPVDTDANKRMALSVYAKGSGTIILDIKGTIKTQSINTNTWQRIYGYKQITTTTPYIPNSVLIAVQKNSTISICAPQLEKGIVPTTYDPNCSYKLLKPTTINIDTINAIDINSTNSNTNKLTYNKLVQKINTSDNSDYPMTWVPQPKCQAVGRVAGVNGDTNALYQCDQWYHYFRTGINLCYIYDHNCKFVNKITVPNYEFWAHDPYKYQSTVVTNRNNKTLLISDAAYLNYKMVYNIYDLNTAQLLTQVKLFDTNGVKGNPDCYALHHVYGGNLSVNDITNNFIIFTKLYHHVETVNEDGSTTITNTALGNGYLSLTEDGYFTKYNPDTQEWILSTEITPEIFTFVENAKASLNWSASLGSVVAFRNTIRGTITNPLLQCVTWVAIITEAAGLDGIFAFNEYDQLIPVRYTGSSTTVGFDANGVLPMNASTYTTNVTSPYSKKIYTINKCYCLVAATQPDTLNATNALVCDLVHGQGIYRLRKNTSTGELDVYRFSATSINSCGYAFVGNVTLDKLALVGVDGGSYGGRGNILYTDNSTYVIPAENAVRYPIKLLGTTCEITRSIGLRSCRLQTAYPSNFHAVNSYSSTWRGALHLEL